MRRKMMENMLDGTMLCNTVSGNLCSHVPVSVVKFQMVEICSRFITKELSCEVYKFC